MSDGRFLIGVRAEDGVCCIACRELIHPPEQGRGLAFGEPVGGDLFGLCHSCLYDLQWIGAAITRGGVPMGHRP